MTVQQQKAGIWSLAWPSIAVYLINTLASLAVIRIASELSTDSVAAVTAGSRIMFMLYAIVMGLGAGTTALVARAWGEQNSKKIALYTRLSLTAACLVALIFSLLISTCAPLITDFFQLVGNAKSETVTYLRWSSAFYIFFCINIIFATALRSAGDALTPLMITVFANLIYLPLAAAWSYGWWGLPAWGVLGIALSGGVAFFVSCVILLGLWYTNRLSITKIPVPWAEQRQQVKRIWLIAYPAILEQAIMQIALMIFLALIANYSTEAFAAYGIGISLLSVTMVIGLGFSMAGSALVGQQLGANHSAGALQVGYRSLSFALLTMSLCGVAAIIWSNELAGLMINDPEVKRLTAVFLIYLGIAQPFLAVDFALSGALRGAGDTRFVLLAAFCGFIVTRLVLASVFVYLSLSIEWVFASLIADYVVKAAMIFKHFRSKNWLPEHNEQVSRI